MYWKKNKRKTKERIKKENERKHTYGEEKTALKADEAS
jgi:hypothetical protein